MAKLHIRSDTVPKFFKPHSVPSALKMSLELKLDRLEAEGNLEKVSHSGWATPIIAVPKKDRTFRICGDYKSLLIKIWTSTHCLNQKNVSFSRPGVSTSARWTCPRPTNSSYWTRNRESTQSSIPICIQGALSIHAFAFWHCIGPSSVPENNGLNSARSATCNLRFR